MKDDRKEAMDKLIAQDADLIEICPDDLVRRLRSTVCQGNLGCHRLVDDDEAADRIEAQAAEIERLRHDLERHVDEVEDQAYELGKRDGYESAVQDIDMLTGGDGEYCYSTVGGERHCPDPDSMKARIADRIEAQAAEIERLNKSAECLAETRRHAVKDLAELEEHMRLEIRQWKVDYDCAIMDVEQLREWVTALEVLLDCAVVDYCDQNGRPKHDSHWVNEARAFLEQSK